MTALPETFSPQDVSHMERALTLAETALGLASPNPQVGCVLVADGNRVGEGTHLYDQIDHAEIVALKHAAAHGFDPRGSAAFVTLEPCSHHGRSGPCADALIAAGIARCVVATLDPNPQVSGRGAAKMREAGILVEVGLLEARARLLNNAFALSLTQARPFVTLKAALSVDGMLAPPPSHRTPAQPYWLTGPESRAEVQRLRHASDAILTGIGTVLADDPALNDRTGLPRRRPLLRVVLDTHLRIPLDSLLVQSAHDDLRIFCGPWELPAPVHALQQLGVRVTAVPAPGGRLDLKRILAHLHQEQVLSILLEGGSALNGAFLQEDLVDQAILFYADKELGPDAIPFALNRSGPSSLEQQFLSVRKRKFGPDLCVTGMLHDPWSSLPPTQLI